jgi:hypothetical protein
VLPRRACYTRAMKYAKRIAVLMVLGAELAACGKSPPPASPNSPAAVDPLIVRRKLSEIAGQSNSASPAAVDEDTRLDGAKAGPGLLLTVDYTLVNAEANGVDKTSFDAKLGAVVKKGTCENPDLRPLIYNGATVVLEYKGLKGDPLGAVKVDRAACFPSK